MKHVLTIAGSDSCGGAGIQADLKTFSALKVYGMSVITAVTAQNTLGVQKVLNITPEIVEAQIDSIFGDISVDAVKIGMVSEKIVIQTISQALKKHDAQNIVLDPVMVSKSGYALMEPESIEFLISYLMPLAMVVTPNIFEAEQITGRLIEKVADMEIAAAMIHSLGPRNVIVKGGHLLGDAIDVLYDGTTYLQISRSRVNTRHTHGTGCTFSSAIAAQLAKGKSVKEAFFEAKEYISGAITNSFSIGEGVGPTHHFFRFYTNEE